MNAEVDRRAVEAAARWLYEQGWRPSASRIDWASPQEKTRTRFREAARATLEAATPALRKQWAADLLGDVEAIAEDQGLGTPNGDEHDLSWEDGARCVLAAVKTVVNR